MGVLATTLKSKDDTIVAQQLLIDDFTVYAAQCTGCPATSSPSSSASSALTPLDQLLNNATSQSLSLEDAQEGDGSNVALIVVLSLFLLCSALAILYTLMRHCAPKKTLAPLDLSTIEALPVASSAVVIPWMGGGTSVRAPAPPPLPPSALFSSRGMSAADDSQIPPRPADHRSPPGLPTQLQQSRMLPVSAPPRPR